MTTNTITYSCELMKNYVHAEIMSPHAKFEALQTATGTALLFSIGTDGVFYLTQETHAADATGWQKTDLSSAMIAKDFSGKTGIVCKSFDVAQNVDDGSIGAALVVSDGQSDHLYLCLGNSNSDTAWLNKPDWVVVPFDNQTVKPASISICNVFLSETENGQFIVVDIVRDPTSPEKLVSRFYIDTDKTYGMAWLTHEIDIDLETDGYASCLGREKGQTIDGLYTIGKVGGNAQFIYQPLYDIWSKTKPPASARPARFSLPGNLTPEALASCRSSDQSTDLFVTAQGGLYYFAANNQKDLAQGVLLLQNDLFTGVSHLFAYHSGSRYVIWGLDQADQVFYTSCNITQITQASAWSFPVPILTGVDLISPYVNLINEGNAFFAVGADNLYRMTQSPVTQLWSSQQITLPPPNNAIPAQSFTSYTTTIQLKNANNQPILNTPLMLSAKSRGNFYINNLAYVLDTTPIPVNTDTGGSITIIEAVNNLQGTVLNVSEQDGNTVQINPIDTPYQKLAKLNSKDNLKNAVITQYDGTTKTTRLLVAQNTSDNNLSALAQANQQLGKAYTQFSSSTPAAASASSGLLSAVAAPATSLPDNFGDAVVVTLGDLFKWLETGVKHFIHEIVEDAIEGVWHFIVTIGEKMYRAVIDCVEKIVGALEWLFNQIKTAIEDLIKFVEFLFEWDDILRTHRVLKNIYRQFVAKCINNLESYPDLLKEKFDEAIKAIDTWANIPDNIPDSLKSSSFDSVSSSAKSPDGLNSPPSQMVSYHLQGNAANSSTSATAHPGLLGDLEAVFKPLLDALETEGEILQSACDSLKNDVIDKIHELSLADLLKAILAIIADALLESIENVVITAIEVFTALVEGILDILDATINIPVISDLYKDITKGDELSILDVACLVSAIPVTVVFKLITNTAPFPDNSATTGLIGAASFDAIKMVANGTPTPTPAVSDMLLSASNTAMLSSSPQATQTIPDNINNNILLASGILAVIGSIGVSVFSPLKQKTPKNPFYSLFNGLSYLAYVSPDIMGQIPNLQQRDWWAIMNEIIADLATIKAMIDMCIGFTTEGSSARNGWDPASPWLDCVMNLVWQVPTTFAYLDSKKTTVDILNLAGGTCFDFSGVLAPALDKTAKAQNPIPWGVLVGIAAVMNCAYGAMACAAGSLTYKGAPS